MYVSMYPPRYPPIYIFIKTYNFNIFYYSFELNIMFVHSFERLNQITPLGEYLYKIHGL